MGNGGKGKKNPLGKRGFLYGDELRSIIIYLDDFFVISNIGLRDFLNIQLSSRDPEFIA
jgi:hypothetical protein